MAFGHHCIGLPLTLLAVALALDACGSDVPRPNAAPSHQRITPNADVLARFAVEQDYAAFWIHVDTIDRLPSVQWRPSLALVATDPELGRQLAAAIERRRLGIHRYGSTIPHVTAVIGAHSLTATVTDCADTSHTGTMG